MSANEADKPYLTEGSREWAEYILMRFNKNDYAQKYTKAIYLRNALSSSVLSYSIDQQIKQKMGEREEVTNEGSILLGEAVHQYLQSKLTQTFIINNEFRAVIPFTWKSIPDKDIIVICHPDAYSLEKRVIHEYKTSFGPNANGRITEPMKRQACFYWWVIKTQIGIDCDVHVVKIWIEQVTLPDGTQGNRLRVSEFTAKPDEKVQYADEMQARALECARLLDDIYGKEGVPQLGNSSKPKDSNSPTK